MRRDGQDRPFFVSLSRMEVINMAMLGKWELAENELKPCKLPQRAESAFTGAMEKVVGAKYDPVLYVGKQIVNGTNYCIIAVQTLVIPSKPTRLVKIVIHEALDKTCKVVSIREVQF